MKGWLIVGLGLLAVHLQPGSAHAQQLLQQLAGVPLYCVAPDGVSVQAFLDPTLQDIGQATYWGQQPVIRMNPAILSQMPPIVQLFFYAHECGHHVSGDILNGILHGSMDKDVELRADMIGIRFVRDQLNPPSAQIQLLLAIIQANPYHDPIHLPGPMRASWIQSCYGTNSFNCQ